MIRRHTVIPFLNWLNGHCTEGTRVDRWVSRALKRSVGRLNDKQLTLLVNGRRTSA